jgi:hypothetical protein
MMRPKDLGENAVVQESHLTILPCRDLSFEWNAFEHLTLSDRIAGVK